NMVDLDSNPTKLIEIVEIGKQLLITRGALTTFSIANDVAKYFAIIPALFAAVYPGLDKLNVMHLASPNSAILSAVIFNALIIVAVVCRVLYPLAVTGIAQVAFHDKANGSEIKADGKVVGSSLIGQSYTTKDGKPDLKWFQGRPQNGLGTNSVNTQYKLILS